MFYASNLAKPRAGRFFQIALVIALPLLSQTTAPSLAPKPPMQAGLTDVLARIKASDLRGDLSFLASDALAGRYTPSPGLDVAAEFIASQFRAAGLRPGGDHDYFQVASMIDRTAPRPPSDMTLSAGAEHFVVPVSSIAITSTSSSISLVRCPVILFKQRSPELLQGHDLAGKVVIAPSVSFETIPPDQRATVASKLRQFDKAVKSSDARALVLVGHLRRSNLSQLLSVEQAGQSSRIPVITVDNDDLSRWLTSPDEEAGRTLTFDVPAPGDQKVQLKNVIAVLPGSDPKLAKTYVMLTAHYDHIGTFETGRGLSETLDPNPVDRIYNGANDDGSGTVSVVEIAKALAHLNPRPKRSIIFMTFFGEERGDIGSTYYGEHPLFPIANTVADLNLEQVGRTDSTAGKHVNDASVTGFDYSDVTIALVKAGKQVGIKVYEEKPASDDYFVRSDNAALAEQGVPAHTLCVAFDYPDYHGLGDDWQKIDYENMARVDRMVALGLVNIANDPIPPKWNFRNAKTEPFRNAQAKLNKTQIAPGH